jgi:hypothetical protein
VRVLGEHAASGQPLDDGTRADVLRVEVDADPQSAAAHRANQRHGLFLLQATQARQQMGAQRGTAGDHLLVFDYA